MKHKNLYLIAFILIFSVGMIWAQTTGDFRSRVSGNWNSFSSWQRYNGSSWVNAISGQTPSSTNSIYIQSGHTITLTQSESCNNFNIAKGTNSSNTTNGTLQLASHNLSIHGIMRNYFAAVGTVPGTSSNSMPVASIVTSATTGKVIIKGSTRSLTSTGAWQTEAPVSFPNSTHYTGSTNVFNLEIDPGAGVTITIPTGMRPQSWNIISGIVDIGSVPKEADPGTDGFGNITIGTDATVQCNLPAGITVFRRIDSKHAGTFTVAGKLIVSGAQTHINMAAYDLSGTVEYNRAGNQEFLRTFVSGVETQSVYNNVILSGSGLKSLHYDATINGTFTIDGTSTFSLNGKVLSYGNDSTLLYAGASSQTTTNDEWPASGGPANVSISNSNGVTLNGNKNIAGNLSLIIGDLVNGAYQLSILGTTIVAGGTYSGGTVLTDGFSDPGSRYLYITANDVDISSFSASTSVGSNAPTHIDREWVLNGSFTGNKNVIFYWNDSEDAAFDWGLSGVAPLIYMGATEITPISYDVSSSIRWAEGIISTFDAKGTVKIGASEEITLPVELSSFTTTITSEYFVKLHWITQSETDALGFIVLRSHDNDLKHAFQVSPLIDATNSATQVSYSYIDNEVTPGTWYYWLQALDLSGSFQFHGPVLATVNTDQDGDIPVIPTVTAISKVYPNPFNPRATIMYTLKEAKSVNFRIYNARGQLVQSFDLNSREAGTHTLSWEADTLPAGTYLIRMQAGNDYYHSKAVISK